MLAALDKAAYRATNARSGRHHSARTGRRRRARPGPHRHRQDGRLRHPDPRTAQARPQRHRRRRRWCSCPRASWPCRSATNSKSWPTAASVRCVPIYGGKPIRGQIDKLQKGADVVIGTPGRVLDHHRPRHARLAISSRSSCSTKPTACSTSASAPTSKKSSAAARKERQTLLLERHGRPAGRTARPHVHARPGGDGLLAEDQGGRHDRAALLHGRPRAEVRPAGAAARSASSRSRRSSSAAPSAAPSKIHRRLTQELPGRRHDARRHGASRPATA